MNTDLRPLAPFLALLLFLALAVAADLRSRRIPNAIVLAGAATGFAFQAAVPHGAGLFHPEFGSIGLLAALGGMAIGLCTLLPMYAMNAMGAGDVKLMSMIGAFLGASDTFAAALASMVAGGLLALGAAVYHGSLPRVFNNMRSLTMGVRPAATGRLPYAVAIATGTVVFVSCSWLAGWSPWH
jgi:prepilin peptidase CpaA